MPPAWRSAARGDRGALGERAALDVHPSRQVGAGEVRLGGAHGARVGIVGVNRRQPPQTLGGAHLGLAAQPRPQRRIVAAPADAAEVVALQARRDVAGDQRRLQRDRARAAHRIEQRLAGARPTRPVGEQEQRRGEVLLQRRGRAGGAIAAAVLALAGEIDADHGAVVVQVEVHLHVRAARVDVRPHAAFVAQLIDDRVLGLQRRVVRVRDARARQAGVDRQRCARARCGRPSGWRGRRRTAPRASRPQTRRAAAGRGWRRATRGSARYATSSGLVQATPARRSATSVAPRSRSSAARSDSMPLAVVAKKSCTARSSVIVADAPLRRRRARGAPCPAPAPTEPRPPGSARPCASKRSISPGRTTRHLPSGRSSSSSGPMATRNRSTTVNPKRRHRRRI